MSALDTLLARAGRWRGTSTLQDPDTGTPDAGPSTAVVTPVLGGRFVRLDYTWRYRGPKERGVIDVRGSYAAPPGPDWGWRFIIAPAQMSLGLVMYNITPAGQEALAVEASYVRA